MKETKRSFLTSCISLLLCFIMLLGTTFAWFTDMAVSANNVIQAGNLDIELQWSKDGNIWHNAGGIGDQPIFNYDKWEPGYTEVRYVKIKNEGSLAFKYQMLINPNGPVGTLAEVIDVSYDVVTDNADFVAPTAANKQGSLDKVGKLNNLINANGTVAGGVLLPDGVTKEGYYTNEIVLCLSLHMDEYAGNEYQNLSIGGTFGIKLIATQFDYENDSFDNSYDNGATWPDTFVGNSASSTVTLNPDNTLASQVTMTSPDGKISATLPAGTMMEQGTTSAILNVYEVENSGANITLNEDEASRSIDVHVNGVADGNTTVMAITVKELLPTGLNMGNHRFYHVEGGNTVEMTLLPVGQTPVHNNYEYDPATGDVVLHLASFSEVAVVAEPPKWEGSVDHSWYDADKTELVIANADQLWSFSQIVGGMNGQTRDSFAGKTVKLISDIDLGDDEKNNVANKIFYPIGYYNSEGTYDRTNTAITSGFKTFEGTFDGNGHTISNFYHNTWEMKGDHDWYSPEEQYYRDGMGLFGRVYKGTVKNLTVSNFSSDGEIATTGVIAAYADGATFENIAIFNCNPRVYNIGNGGIVGCVGWYAKEEGLKTTFTNITVDNSNKISALWGSYDVACGGIVGQYYPTSGQSSAEYPVNAGIHFENCHVSAVMDVYNDVCANYQYYAYRYTGMLIGSVRENETINGHVYPKMDGITASGCTVHFGDWNDYYYCEIIDNTTASYTHDYQMSRLTEIKAIDGTTITYLDGTEGTVPASGRANYVIVDYTKGHGTENATCYHFKDGAVWTHDMGGIQTGIDENGDGQDDLKEDKQHIYLEFNNLVTGYGWGVTSKGVGDLAGVTILDREVGDSVNKFAPVIGNETAFSTESTVTIGELFNAVIDAEVAINPESIQVAVSPFGTDSTAGGTYAANATDWEQGTLTFSGVGKAVITITDYYFCNTASVTVNIIATDKFDTNFVNHEKYLYRVGNQNTVSLGTIFKALDDANIDSSTVNVSFVTMAGNASGTFTPNATWTNGTIQFTGTGVVKVTIKDATSSEFVLNLEVIDAENLTSAKGHTGADHKNFVLVKDISTTVFINHWNSTIYGNGFTYSLNGGPTKYDSKQGHGILIAKNTTFDNIVIIGDVYGSYGAYSNQDYYTAAIDATNTIIQNSYIANCSTPVRGNGVTITNTTLYGGTVANLILSGGTNTLKDVTTINYNDDRSIVGFGIVVNDEASENTKIVIEGALKQYNYVCQSDNAKVPGSEAKQLFNSMFDGAFSDYKTDTGYVNTGIIIMSEALNTDIITGSVPGYEKLDDASLTLTVSGFSKSVNGAVYAPKGAGVEVDNNYNFDNDGHVSTKQGVYLPTFEFDLGDYFDANDGENDTRYCYESVDNEKIRLLYQDGQDGFTFDLTKLASATKYGYSLNTTVVCKNSAGVVLATNSSVTLKDAGMYYFEITISDDIIYGADGSRTGEINNITYTIEVELSVKKASWKNAEIQMTNASANSGYNSSKYYVLVFLDTIQITDYTEDGTSEKVDLKAEYESYEITYVNNTSYAWSGFTLTINYTDGRILTVTFAAPSGLSSPGASAGGKTISLKSDNTYGYVLQSDGKINTKVSGTWSITKCTFKGNNTVTVENADGIALNVDQNTTINVQSGSSGDSGGSCITPDTLITLADGTQVRVDSLTGNEELLVWNLETGKLDKAPIMFIDSDPEAEYKVVHLYFSDGTDVKVIYEHGFWDYDLNKYVYLDENAAEYIGHTFAKHNGDSLDRVQLTDVIVETELTTAWSPVTVGHLCYFVNGMLSMPGGVGGLFNIFEVDPETMTYDFDKLQKDIETYGLYTYEELNAICPLSEEMFNAAGGAYLKISIGKGNLTIDELINMINRYSKFI